jgi:hypothetical protein
METTAVDYPGPTDRIFVVGRTGSGKTVAANWHLSFADFVVKPWIIYDFKGDELIAEIARAKLIDVGEIPTHPGIYIAHPEPEDARIEDHLMSIWAKEDLGLYIDEGYMIDQRSRGLRTLATQGRSKNIPLIVLSQQPLWVNKFAISEADFHQVFSLANSEHHKIVRQFTDITSRDIETLPEYHSMYYDVRRKAKYRMPPVDSIGSILDRFDRRLKKTSLRKLI